MRSINSNAIYNSEVAKESYKPKVIFTCTEDDESLHES